jgi:hypothetical protein
LLTFRADTTTGLIVRSRIRPGTERARER